MIDLFVNDMATIGLEINADKSSIININCDVQEALDGGVELNNNKVIHSLAPGETIRYLGVNFQNEIVFGEMRMVADLTSKLLCILFCTNIYRKSSNLYFKIIYRNSK